MKKNYTQFLTGILTLVFGFLFVSSTNAQYVINTGGGDQFTLQIGDVGQYDGIAFTAPLMAASSNCSPLTNGADGILIFDADAACSPAYSAELADLAGGVAVIVCGAAGVDYTATEGSGIDIPCFVLSEAECVTLKTSVGTDATIDLLVPDCNRNIPTNAVWGLNGEGEFDGGLNGWTIDNENGFFYDPKGKLDRGAYNSNTTQIVSPTLCNGAVVADSSFGDNAGEPGNFLSGNCPSDAPDVYCESRLTSPTIDLSGLTYDGLFLQFFQAVRQYQSEFYVLVSVDGGSTFRDTIQINQGLAVNSAHIQDIIKVPLLNIEPTDELQIRLWYRGSYYYWAVDDFFLLSETISDVRLNTDGGNFFAAHAPNYETPSSQADIIPLLVDVENIGNNDVDDVSLTASLLDANGNVLDEASLDYGTIIPGFVDQNRLFDDVFTMPTEVGTYTVVYTLNSSADQVLENNSYSSSFKVSDGVFSKCDPVDATARIAFPDQQYQSIGAGYHVTNSTNADGQQLYINSLRVGISGVIEDAVAGSIGISIYEWTDLNQNTDVDAFDGTGIAERVKVYETSILVFGGEALPDLEDTTIDLGDDAVALKDNTNYLVVLHGAPLAASDTYRWMAADAEANSDYDFGATAFAFGPGSEDGVLPDGSLGTITSNPLNMTRIGCIGGTGADGDADTRRLFQVNNFAALAEMHIGASNSITEEINENIKLSVFPNPASDKVFVDIALENNSEKVNLQVVDIQGKVVMTQNFANVKSDKLQLNVNDLNTGVYVINIRTEEGFTSAKFIKD